jgi:signal transduction histidine kinase
MESARLGLEPGARRTRALAWSLAALGLLAVAATAMMVVLNRSVIHSVDEADPIELILPIGYAIMGALVAIRRPRNPIGWIFLGLAIFGGWPGFAQQYLLHDRHIAALPAAAWIAWTHDWVIAVVFPAGLATFFFLLFPDGRFASRRWRRLGWVAVAFTVVAVALSVVQPATVLEMGRTTLRIRNPIAVRSLDLWKGPVGAVLWIGGIAILVTAMVGTALRMRRSAGEERQQLKWLAYAALGTVTALVVNVVVSLVYRDLSNVWFDLVIVAGFGLAIPISCGVAMLKYGLYEIDVVVNKTVMYVVLAAFFTVVYVAVVVGIGTAIGSNRNPFLTLLAAVVIAAAFNPVRERAKRFANHIVYGKRATPYEVLSEFAERMAGTYALEDVLPRMARILGEGTGARRATVWLRVGQRLRPAAVWGQEDAGVEPVSVDGEALPPMEDVTKVVAVREGGDLLGALSITKPPNEPLATAEEKLIEDLGAQTGLVLRNVRLTEELRANLDELQASRQRIVTAQDEARRRLERNIHDGAQQQLVSLAVKARLAESLADRNPEGQRDLLAQIGQGLQEALEDLRDLARGIYPPLLADQGLVPALAAQARKAPLPVEIEADGLGRYAQEQEAAVYFCTLEALQNIAKYAGASKAVVRLSQQDGHLAFGIEDDGVGFDPSVPSFGTGLQGMADRLAALGGSLVVESRPGAGTTVAGSLPVHSMDPVR